MLSQRQWAAALIAAVVVRLASLGLYPLADTTEARYAEIARLMVATHDWITPQIALGVPFWAKPPLSVWLTAGSFSVFGINEFAARLPAALLFFASCALIYRLTSPLLGRTASVVACTVALTTVVGFVGAGAAMTDGSLLFAVCLSMTAFWLAVTGERRLWQYAFFVGLGLGLLAKGPIALVLVGLPIAIWSLLRRDIRWLLKAMPWFSGSLLTLLIAVPWYWAAETKTPGFLEYFLVGEHFLRFVDAGWQGDLYGNAHAEAKGSIWLFGFLGLMPWSLIAIAALGKAIRKRTTLSTMPSFYLYLLLWVATPLVFFTFAANILAAYVLPGLPAFAILVSAIIVHHQRTFHGLAWLVPIAFVGIVAVQASGMFQLDSQKGLVARHDAASPDVALYYHPKVPYSASFYSGGRATALGTEEAIREVLVSKDPADIAIRDKKYVDVYRSQMPCWESKTEMLRHVVLHKRSGCTSLR